MNLGIFIGCVGQDAELKYTSAGKPVCSFSMAIDQGKDKEGEKRSPLWIKATLWEKRAESLVEYIKKGKRVMVQGPVNTEAWTSKESGDAQSKIVVTVREFEFCGGPKSEESNSEAAPKTVRPTVAPPPPGTTTDSTQITDEDIPF
jgi:single-strand DNA-binding protein